MAPSAPSSLVVERSGSRQRRGSESSARVAANSGGESISGYAVDQSSGALADLKGSPFSAAGASVKLLAVTPSTMTPPTLTSLQVTPASVSVDSSAFGKHAQFTCIGNYSDGSTRFLTATAKWTSSNTSVGTVQNSPNHAGLATTMGVGTATLTATIGSLTAAALLTVAQPSLVSIAVTPANPTVGAGTSIQFKAVGTYADGATQNLTKTATWQSSSSAVARIGATGEATALQAGSTTISASAGSVAGSTALSVQ